MLHAASECSTWATSGSLQERDRVTPGRSVEFLLFSQYFLSVHASTSKPPRLGKWMTYNVMNISNGIANGNSWSSSISTTSLMASRDVILMSQGLLKGWFSEQTLITLALAWEYLIQKQILYRSYSIKCSFGTSFIWTRLAASVYLL